MQNFLKSRDLLCKTQTLTNSFILYGKSSVLFSIRVVDWLFSMNIEMFLFVKLDKNLAKTHVESGETHVESGETHLDDVESGEIF